MGKKLFWILSVAYLSYPLIVMIFTWGDVYPSYTVGWEHISGYIGAMLLPFALGFIGGIITD